MPKLLQINATLNLGSTGRIAEQIANAAKKKGWDCFLAHGGRYVGQSNYTSIQVSSKRDNYFHAFYGEFLGKHGLGSTRATKHFVEQVKALKPDIIHLHNIHGYYLNYRVLFEYLAYAKIPIVWTLHDCWAFTGHCTHFEMVSCEKWQTECEQCPLKMAQYKTRLIDRSQKNYQLKKQLYKELSNVTLVPVSNWLAGLVAKSILGNFPIHVINNGVDVNVFKPTNNTIRDRYGIPIDKKIILGVVGSGFGDEKGEREFIELSKQNDLQIIIVGLKGNESQGLPPNIIRSERTSSLKELAAFYSAADVFLNPTYNDTFPTTNLEALACGTPVITYRTGGSPEALDDSTGIVVDKGDLKGLNGAIYEVIHNGKEYYSAACVKRAIDHYNKDDRFDEYIKLYESLL